MPLIVATTVDVSGKTVPLSSCMCIGAEFQRIQAMSVHLHLESY